MLITTNRCLLPLRLLVAVGVLIVHTHASAKPTERLGIGLRFSYMPTGTFALQYDNGIARSDTASAIHAFGVGAFLDYAFNSYVAVGIGPEAVLNVLPDIQPKRARHMLNIAARMKLTYPLSQRLHLYAVVAPGYGVIFLDPIKPRGFTLAGSAGTAFRLTRMNAVFVELGYLAGFQRTNGDYPGERYSPSYLVTSCGWQFSI